MAARIGWSAKTNTAGRRSPGSQLGVYRDRLCVDGRARWRKMMMINKIGKCNEDNSRASNVVFWLHVERTSCLHTNATDDWKVNRGHCLFDITIASSQPGLQELKCLNSS